MDRKAKIKWCLLNIICFFITTFFLVLFWQYLTIGALKQKNDYAIFRKSAIDTQSMYEVYHFAKIHDARFNKSGVTIYHDNPSSGVNLNTPLASVVLKKMITGSAHFSVNTALWIFFSVLGVVISVVVLLQIAPSFPQKKYSYIPLITLICISWPVIFNATTGELALFLLPLLCLGFYYDQQKNYLASSLILGLLASLKLFFLLFILLFAVRRQWKLMIIFLITFLGFFFLPLVFLSPHEYVMFFNQMTNKWEIINRSMNPLCGSIMGFVAKLFQYTSHKNISIKPILLLAYGFSAYLVVRWVMHDWKIVSHLNAFSDALRFSFLVVLSLLISPLSWMYYDVFFIIPLFTFILISKKYTYPYYFYLILLFVLCLPYFTMIRSVGEITSVIQAMPVFLSTVFLLICLLLSVKVIEYGNKVNEKNNEIMFSIVVFSLVLGALLISINDSLPYFFNLNKTPFLQKEKSIIFLPKK